MTLSFWFWGVSRKIGLAIVNSKLGDWVEKDMKYICQKKKKKIRNAISVDAWGAKSGTV